MPRLELIQYNNDSIQSKNIPLLKLARFPLAVKGMKKSGYFEIGFFLTEWSCSYIVLALVSIKRYDVRFQLCCSRERRLRRLVFYVMSFIPISSLVLALLLLNGSSHASLMHFSYSPSKDHHQHPYWQTFGLFSKIALLFKV